MSYTSKIEWCESTWNPVRGCTKISPGCAHCYAETMAERFRGTEGHAFEQGFDLRLVPEKLAEPFTWKKPRSIFVNSMSDLFHKDIPVDYVKKVCDVMLQANWHTYMVLTKRADRMLELLNTELIQVSNATHIWWGVSVENQKHGIPRIDLLRETPVPIKFLSIEPLLEDLGILNLEDINWVVVGGESGFNPRPIRKAWVISIKRQCRKAQIPFFFKQWGGRYSKQAGRLLDGRTYDEKPTRIELPVVDNATRLQLSDLIIRQSKVFESHPLCFKKKRRRRMN